MSSTERFLNKESIVEKLQENLERKAIQMLPEVFTYSFDWENLNVVLSVTDANNRPLRNETYSFESLGVSDKTLADYWIYKINLPGVKTGDAIRIHNDYINQLNQYNAICVVLNCNQISFITLLASEPIYTRLLTAREIYNNNITIKKLFDLDEARDFFTRHHHGKIIQATEGITICAENITITTPLYSSTPNTNQSNNCCGC